MIRSIIKRNEYIRRYSHYAYLLWNPKESCLISRSWLQSRLACSEWLGSVLVPGYCWREHVILPENLVFFVYSPIDVNHKQL